MIRELKKLYHNKYADLRSYEVEDAMQKGDSIRIVHRGRSMVLTPRQLVEKRLIFSSKPIKSKVNKGQIYTLYSYLFEPDKPKTEEEKAIEFCKQQY